MPTWVINLKLSIEKSEERPREGGTLRLDPNDARVIGNRVPLVVVSPRPTAQKMGQMFLRLFPRAKIVTSELLQCSFDEANCDSFALKVAKSLPIRIERGYRVRIFVPQP